MAQDSDQSQKTQQPTAQKIAKAVTEGDVLMSRELMTALAVLAGVFWLAGAGSWFVDACQQLLVKGLSFSRDDLTDFAPQTVLIHELTAVAVPMLLLFVATLLVSILGTAALGSLGWRNKAFLFKGSRLSPIAGFKRMFGAHAGIELGKALAKVLLLGAIGYAVLADQLPAIMSLAAGDVAGASRRAGGAVIDALLALAGGLVVIALIDVPAQWQQRRRRLMMTVDELRRETRENDGSPEVKGQQRARQREILSGSARKAVSEAAVVLTNPTHFAVALRYRPGIDAVPMVVARGRDETALAIRQLAAQANVAVLQYPQLTRALYFSVRAGRTIPEELFVAVAMVLAFVFRLDAQAAAAPPPPVDVPPSHRYDAQGRREA